MLFRSAPPKAVTRQRCRISVANPCPTCRRMGNARELAAAARHHTHEVTQREPGELERPGIHAASRTNNAESGCGHGGAEHSGRSAGPRTIEAPVDAHDFETTRSQQPPHAVNRKHKQMLRWIVPLDNAGEQTVQPIVRHARIQKQVTAGA